VGGGGRRNTWSSIIHQIIFAFVEPCFASGNNLALGNMYLGKVKEKNPGKYKSRRGRKFLGYMQLNPMLLSLELESSRTGEDIIMTDRSTYANALVFSLLIILLKS